MAMIKRTELRVHKQGKQNQLFASSQLTKRVKRSKISCPGHLQGNVQINLGKVGEGVSPLQVSIKPHQANVKTQNYTNDVVSINLF